MQDLFIVTYSLFFLILDCLRDFQIMQMRIAAGKTDKKDTDLWSKKAPPYSITEVVVLEIRLFYFQRGFLLHFPLMLISTQNPVKYHA